MLKCFSAFIATRASNSLYRGFKNSSFITTMTTQLQSAILVDFFPFSESSSGNRHCVFLKHQVSNLLSDGDASFSLVQLYILTSSDDCVTEEFDSLVPRTVGLQRTVLRADERIASFYEAKTRLDDLEITAIQLVCSTELEHFWRQVCLLLFTPVHDWVIRTASRSEVSGLSANIFYCMPLHSNVDKEQADKACINQESISGTTSVPSHQPSESIRIQVERYLTTLPSLLAPPEVDRSQLLLGEMVGFVHGFSTRRGGITRRATQCSMNLAYTDKKRDAQLVVNENRRRLGTVGGFDHLNFHLAKVEHGNRVWIVGEEQPDKFDAVVTDRRGVTIAAPGADCIPLLFADPVAMVIGAAHAGWKGTVMRVAECVVQTMQRLGSKPEDIRVAMGPGVRLGCFSVFEEDVKSFRDIHPSCAVKAVVPVSHRVSEPFLQNSNVLKPELPADGCGNLHGRENSISSAVQAHRTWGQANVTISDIVTSELGGRGQNENSCLVGVSNCQPNLDFTVQLVPPDALKPPNPPPQKDGSLPRPFVDIQLANYHVLLQAGVKPEHIDMRTSHCTKCNPELYFSYERDGFPFGNQIGFICMTSAC